MFRTDFMPRPDDDVLFDVLRNRSRFNGHGMKEAQVSATLAGGCYVETIAPQPAGTSLFARAIPPFWPCNLMWVRNCCWNLCSVPAGMVSAILCRFDSKCLAANQTPS